MLKAAHSGKEFNKRFTSALPSYYIRFFRCNKVLNARKLSELHALFFARLSQDRFNLYHMRSAKIGDQVRKSLESDYPGP